MTRRSRDREVARALSRLLHEFLAGRLDRPTLAGRLERLARWLHQEAPAPPPAANPEHVLAWDRIFAHWRRAIGKKLARPTQSRRTKVLARLREGYTEQQLVQAIDGCAASAFHTGENEAGREYNDLELICRSGSKVEQFIAMAPERSSQGDPVLARAQSEAQLALQEGRMEDYETWNDRARARLSDRAGADPDAERRGAA